MRCTWRPEHHADLLAHLVREDDERLRLRDDCSELSHRLRHETRLKPHVAVAHVAVDLCLRNECRDGVDYDHVKSARLRELLADRKRLFAAVRLGDDQVVEIDADLLRVAGVKRVFRVDERRYTARLLGVRDDVQGKRSLAGRLLAVAFDDASARKPADAKCHVERKRAGGNHGDFLHFLVAETHNRHLAEFLAYLAHHRVKRGIPGFLRRFFRCHTFEMF